METISCFHLLTVRQEKILKSEHPTKFGKTSKKDKNIAMIFREDKLEVKHDFGLCLETSFIVSILRKDKSCLGHTPMYGRTQADTHPTYSSGHTHYIVDVLQGCRIDDKMER